MAFPMLVEGSDCGPVNPLRLLTKPFDHDRGIQQDQFGVGRAGSSRETFRTQPPPSRQIDKDAADFFSGTRVKGPSPFDLSGISLSLPVLPAEAPLSFQPSQQQNHVPLASWAADFMQHQQHGSPAVTTTIMSPAPEVQSQPGTNFHPSTQGNQLFWPPSSYHPMQHLHSPTPMNGVQIPSVNVQHDPSLWDQDFLKEEQKPAVAVSEPTVVGQELAPERIAQNPAEADALSRTAGLLLDTLRDEQNPKFKNSEFMGLMRSLRDRTLVVEGNEIVFERGSVSERSAGNGVDVKGKGRATDVGSSSQTRQPLSMNSSMGVPLQFQGSPFVERVGEALPSRDVTEQLLNQATESSSSSVDEVYEYFRQDNEDYIQYQNARYPQLLPDVGNWDDNTAEWGQLQQDWDSFEATSTGMRPTSNYQFTANNPYLVGERSSATFNHMNHSNEVYESVLELEAIVQRDPTNAQAWFALGVKQQDNEREPKAIEALRRSVELDPKYMPSWLALGISHTNESNRTGAYDAIREWVERHERYASLTAKLSNLNTAGSSLTERYEELINCVIAMARSGVDGEIDADIQVALAVLLNSNEEYAKATDCFLTALAVRPHDWVLYNRVGATLANNGSAEEALEYYHRALELNPMYIRARFNAGISCINLHRYEESGRHIFDALTLQDSDTIGEKRGGVTSVSLWNCLRTVCVHMDRMELAAMCDSRDLEGLRGHFHSR